MLLLFVVVEMFVEMFEGRYQRLPLAHIAASEGGRHAGRCKRRCRCCRSPLQMVSWCPSLLVLPTVDFRDHKFGINIFITQSKNTKRKPPKTCCKRLRIDLHDVRAQKYKTFLLVSKEATASHRTPQNSPVHLSRRSSRKVWSERRGGRGAEAHRLQRRRRPHTVHVYLAT